MIKTQTPPAVWTFLLLAWAGTCLGAAPADDAADEADFAAIVADTLKDTPDVTDPPATDCAQDKVVYPTRFSCGSAADKKAIWVRANLDPDHMLIQLHALDDNCSVKLSASEQACFANLFTYANGRAEITRANYQGRTNPRAMVEEAKKLSGDPRILDLPAPAFFKGGKPPADWRAQVEYCRSREQNYYSSHPKYAYCSEIRNWSFAEYRDARCGSTSPRALRIFVPGKATDKWLTFNQADGPVRLDGTASYKPQVEIVAVRKDATSSAAGQHAFVANYLDGRLAPTEPGTFADVHPNGPTAALTIPGSYDRETQGALELMAKKIEDYGRFDNTHITRLPTLTPPRIHDLNCRACHGSADALADPRDPPGMLEGTPYRNAFTPELAAMKLGEYGESYHRSFAKEFGNLRSMIEIFRKAASLPAAQRARIEAAYIGPDGKPVCGGKAAVASASRILKLNGKNFAERGRALGELMQFSVDSAQTLHEIRDDYVQWRKRWLRGQPGCSFARRPFSAAVPAPKAEASPPQLRPSDPAKAIEEAPPLVAPNP